MKLCIVGGGGSVAVATRIITERMPGSVINVFTRRDVAGYRPCELTYVLGRQIPDFETIVAFDQKAMEARGVTYHFATEVTEINRTEKRICSSDGTYEYDKLILATGAEPFKPGIPGIDGKGVYVLGTDMRYARELSRVINDSTSALIMGAGAIGLEVAEVLVRRGYRRVIVADVADRPLARSLDREIADMVTAGFRETGVEMWFSQEVTGIEDAGAGKRVYLKDASVDVDFVLVSVGFRPNSGLAARCGLEIGPTGGVKVNRYMQTSDPDIYAIGDVAEGWDLVGDRPILPMKADNAVRTGRVAARHISGDTGVAYLGSSGGFIIYLNETFVGGVGYTEEAARTLPGKSVKSAWHEGMTLPKYLGGQPIKIKIVYDAATGLLLGAQMFSKANMAAELDRLSLAITEKIPVHRLAGAETIYTPASGWPYGPIAQALDKCY